MNADRPGPDEAVDELCGRFEAAWQRGEWPDLDEYLRQAGPLRTAALLELVLVEAQLRRRDGERPRAEEYLRRYPELRDIPHAVEQIMAATGGPAPVTGTFQPTTSGPNGGESQPDTPPPPPPPDDLPARPGRYP